MIAAALHLTVAVVIGLLLFAVCFFVAGWVVRGELAVWQRTPTGRRRRGAWSKPRRRRPGVITRSPW